MLIGTCSITRHKDAAEGSASAGARSLISGLWSSTILLCFPGLSDLVSIPLVLCLRCTSALQPQDAQPGIPFDQFVVREPTRVRRLELEPSGAPDRLQYGAPAQAQQVQLGADRSGYPELRPLSRQYDTSEGSASQQSGQPYYRDSGRSSKSSAAGLPRRGQNAARAVPDQAWPAASAGAPDQRGDDIKASSPPLFISS